MAVEIMNGNWKASILIIEDDPDQVRLYSKALRQYSLKAVTNGTEALQSTAEEMPDVIILDNILAGGEIGTQFLPKLKTELAHVPIIVISGTLDVRAQIKALQGPYSAQFVIEKPVDIDELRAAVESALNDCGMAETIREIRSLERAEMIKTSEPERQFAERLARQHQIMQDVRRTNDKPNVSQLARHFRVSRRTIARDLQDLVNRGQLVPTVLS